MSYASSRRSQVADARRKKKDADSAQYGYAHKNHAAQTFRVTIALSLDRPPRVIRINNLVSWIKKKFFAEDVREKCSRIQSTLPREESCQGSVYRNSGMMRRTTKARTVHVTSVYASCTDTWCRYIQGLRTKLNAYWQSPRCLSALCTYHYNVCGLVRSTRRQRTSITSSNPGHRRQIRPPPICQQSRHSVSINSSALWLRQGGLLPSRERIRRASDLILDSALLFC